MPLHWRFLLSSGCFPQGGGWVQRHPRARGLLLALALCRALSGAVPTFLRFEPKAQAPGAWATLHGTHLDEVTEVRLGSRTCPFNGSSDGLTLGFEVPAGTKPGSCLVTVRYGLGDTAKTLASGPFLVLPEAKAPLPAPEEGKAPQPPSQPARHPLQEVADPPDGTPGIKSIHPLHGAPGDRVILRGTGLGKALRITLGLHTVTEFQIVNDGEIILRVPKGHPATAEFIVFAQGQEDLYSPFPFRVAGERHQGPAVTRFWPPSARAEEIIHIEGSHLEEVVGVIIGGKLCPQAEYQSGRLAVSLEPGCSGTHPIILLHRSRPGGALVQEPSAQAFEVIPPGPIVTRIDPTEGPAGTPVVISGHNLQGVESISFGRSQATAILQHSDTEVWALAPLGAAWGPLTLRARGGETSATPDFNLEDKPDPLILQVERMHLTQAVQRPDGSVPLVAHRAAMLRIFLRANRGNDVKGRVRVWLRPAEGPEQVREVTLEGPGVPTVLDEMRLTSTCNLLIPAEQMLPGLAVRAELLPVEGASLAPGLSSCPRAGSFQALELHRVPPVSITFLPIRQRGLVGEHVGDITEGNLPVWVADLRKMLPLGEIDANLGNELVTAEPMTDIPSLSRVLDVLIKRRDLEGRRGLGHYYIGVFHAHPHGSVEGLSENSHDKGGCCLVHDLPGITSCSPATITLAHEMGHLFGRNHAPGNTEASATEWVDPHYPYADGTTGAVGVDLVKGVTLDPQLTFDVMGYDAPFWISAYTYEGIFNYLMSRP